MISYHASHEQFAPSALLRYASMAADAGFNALHSSDHFHPWSERQGQCGFSFAWMGAAMQATRLPCGVVCAPGQRYHPAIVAQAAATLAEMFPGKFWISLGSGEALNENITGIKWPAKAQRNERLLESVNIIRALLRGETVSHAGHVVIEDAKLYTRPLHPPLLLGAAVTNATAAWLGTWADGMITVHKEKAQLQQVVDSFYNGGGKGKPLYLKVQLSYARNLASATAGAFDQWKNNILPGEILDDLWQVKQFDAASQFVRPEDVARHVHVSNDPQYFIDLINQYIDMGFSNIILHNVNREQESFIRDFGEVILPNLAS